MARIRKEQSMALKMRSELGSSFHNSSKHDPLIYVHSYFSGFVNKDIAFNHVASRSLIVADLLFNLPANEQVRIITIRSQSKL